MAVMPYHKTCRLEHLIQSAARKALDPVVLFELAEGNVANSTLRRKDLQSVYAGDPDSYTLWIYSLP